MGLLLLLSYVLNNQTLFTGEDLNQYAWTELLKNKLGIKEQKQDVEALFINVAYDKQLIEITDEYGMPVGNTDVTDRAKLLRILRLLHQSDSYHYIFLDVRFEKGYSIPEIDSLLFNEIISMRNIVVANHSDIEIADKSLLPKTALSDYYSTIVATNFARYKYLYGSISSVPLYAYHELTGQTIEKHGIFYTCSGRLCQNSLLIPIPIRYFGEYNGIGDKVYYNLGSDLLDSYSEADLSELVKDKYIVIGDMVEDIHDTYSGPTPGSVLTYYAFLELMKERHFVSWGLMSFLALLYFSISLSLFSKKSIVQIIPIRYRPKSRLMLFAMSFLGYSLTLSATAIGLNVFFSKSVSIFIPSTLFAIQKTIINYQRNRT